MRTHRKTQLYTRATASTHPLKEAPYFRYQRGSSREEKREPPYRDDHRNSHPPSTIRRPQEGHQQRERREDHHEEESKHATTTTSLPPPSSSSSSSSFSGQKEPSRQEKPRVINERVLEEWGVDDDDIDEEYDPEALKEAAAKAHAEHHHEGEGLLNFNEETESKQQHATMGGGKKEEEEEEEQKGENEVLTAEEAYVSRLGKEKKGAEEMDEARKVCESKMKEWAEESPGKLKNIRSLLSTLHTVLWEGTRWKEVSLGDLLDYNNVKKSVMKARLIVAPDKNINKPAETRYIARYVYEAINEAYDAFQQSER